MRKEDRLHDILEMFEIGEIDFDETKTRISVLFGVGDSLHRKPKLVGNSTFIKKLREKQESNDR